jgi:hypothetical protein
VSNSRVSKEIIFNAISLIPIAAQQKALVIARDPSFPITDLGQLTRKRKIEKTNNDNRNAYNITINRSGKSNMKNMQVFAPEKKSNEEDNNNEDSDDEESEYDDSDDKNED